MKETGLDYYARFMDGETEIQKEEREGTQAPGFRLSAGPGRSSGDGSLPPPLRRDTVDKLLYL